MGANYTFPPEPLQTNYLRERVLSLCYPNSFLVSDGLLSRMAFLEKIII